MGTDRVPKNFICSCSCDFPCLSCVKAIEWFNGFRDEICVEKFRMIAGPGREAMSEPVGDGYLSPDVAFAEEIEPGAIFTVDQVDIFEIDSFTQAQAGGGEQMD